MTRQSSAHPLITTRGSRGQQKERSISVPPRLLRPLSPCSHRLLCEQEVARLLFAPLFSLNFQFGGFAINNVKKGQKSSTVELVVDGPELDLATFAMTCPSSATPPSTFKLPRIAANFRPLPFPVPVSLSDSGQKRRRLGRRLKDE